MKIIKPKNVEITATISDVSTVRNVTYAFQIIDEFKFLIVIFDRREKQFEINPKIKRL